MNRTQINLIALGLFALALIFRLVGIGWGLKNDLHNQSYHPDELVTWSYAQRIEPAKLKFDPGFYNYGTLYLTMLRVSSDMVSVYGGKPNPENPDSLWTFVSKAHLAGRVLSAIAGALTVVAIFLILLQFSNLIGAVMGSLLVLLAPGHLVHSRFQTVDILATCFLAFGTYFALSLLKEPTPVSCDTPGRGHGTFCYARRLTCLAALFFGLSAGVKYTGILGLLTLFVCLAYLPRERKEKWQLAGIGTLATLFVFLITTPGAIFNNAKFTQDFLYEIKHSSTGHGLVFAGTPSGFIYHFSNLVVGIGFILVVLGLAGLIVAAWRRHRWVFALLAFFIPYYILIGKSEVKFFRYTFPLYIGLAAGFGWLVGRAHEKGAKHRLIVMFGILGLGGIGGGGLKGALDYTTWMASEDPRDAAARYLKSQSNEATVVGLASDPWYYTPALFRDSTTTRAVPFADRDAAMRAVTSPRVERYVPSDPNTRIDWDTRLLAEKKPEYVVYSSIEEIPVAKLGSTLAGPDIAPFLPQFEQYGNFRRKLQDDYMLVKTFGKISPGVEDMQYVQPVLWIWKRKA